MKPAPVLASMLLLAGCQTALEPQAAAPETSYQAFGGEPFWNLTIDENLIVLDTGLNELDGPGQATWPRPPSRNVGGVRTWEAGDGGTSVISIEARPEPCITEGQEIYEDHVRVRLSGVELNGCGGRLIGREDD